MYQFLLSTIDQEVYEFFSFLLDNRLKKIDLTTCAKQLKHSKNRMLMICDRAKEFRQNYPYFTLEIADDLTIYCHFSSNFLLSKLYALMLEDTIPFRILDRLFSQKYISLEKTAQQYFVSDRTVQRKLKELDRILSNYNIGLDLKSKSLFKGAEYRIRYFFHTMYWQVFDENRIKNFDLKKSSLVQLRQRLTSLPTHYRNIDIDKFIQIIAISVYRMKRGYFIHEIPQEMTEINHLYISFDTFKEEIMTPLFEENYLHMNIPKKEYYFLYYMFTVITTYLPEEVPEQLKKDQQTKGAPEMAWLFARTAQSFFKLPLSKVILNYLVMNVLTIHSTSIVFASENKMDAFGKSTTEADYLRVFPKIYPRVKEMYALLSEQSPFFAEMYTANNRLLFQYSMLLSLVVQPSAQPIRLFHESKFGKIQEAKQKRRIRQLLNDAVVFVDEAPEIVLTDYPVDREKFKKQNPDVHFFKWHSFQTTEKWVELVEYIEQQQENV
ncbi:helix-turn-helix domain-containing protein [Enterococcus wangshanyuanii]|uniref:Mga helix-turn-helix domain-containing protein n=1 Tax=Enterococcus wangshanyuanii TaxID=2005703 RepID=A0ABQ1NKJ0_9ENTE|nr:helix-turn-helix domain-containing protein [Enterococcus wangshanyuanii]GGC79567.1 hypothetical protein GCM10011573_06560 [Enterococcus wangshanyuanii]